jgi:hypothetical protein
MKFTTTLLALASLASASPAITPRQTRVAVPASEPHNPTHPGVADDCAAYYKIQSGDICLTVASAFSITVDQLATWNSVGGRDCPYLALGYYACVAVGPSATPTTTTTGVVATPTPTQEGLVAGCTKFDYLEIGDTCSALAEQYGIDERDVVRWNPAAGPTCSGLRAGYWACVGASEGV